MDKIKVPTQIIWGKQDQVCSMSRGPPVPVTPASEEKQEVIYQVSLTGWFLIPGGGGTHLGQVLIFIGVIVLLS